MLKNITLIPARKGSKKVVNKNIRDLCNQPLISYSILDSLAVSTIQETYVSTDSIEIGQIALQYGAEVPFFRPESLAQDDSLLIDVVKHFLHEFYKVHLYHPENIVLLLPTTPLRDVNVIKQAIDKINQYSEATGLRSVHEFVESPYKWFTSEREYLKPLLTDDWDMLDRPRQTVPKVLVPNGYVDIIKSETVLKQNSVYGKKILSFITDYAIEIDSEEGFVLAEEMMKRRL